ncbi:MAG: hypothetical protein ACFFCQ_02700 [Promethearchaeota archaeon]
MEIFKQKKKAEQPVFNDLLQGKTLQIYWYLLTNKEAGIRRIQKDLLISSPSTVSYHVNKLTSVGLVSQSLKTGKYYVLEEVQDGILGLYVKIGRRMIPRFIMYLSYFSFGIGMFTIFLFQRTSPINLEDLLFYLFSCSALLIFSYEAIKVWRMKPL